MPDAVENSTPTFKPEIVESDPFRDYALLARQYWCEEYFRLYNDHPLMTLEEYLDLNWQNKPSRTSS